MSNRTPKQPRRVELGEMCPDCGDGEIVVRENRQTSERFYGCSTWPECEWASDEPERWSRRDEGGEDGPDRD